MNIDRLKNLYDELNFMQDGSKPRFEDFKNGHQLKIPVSIRYNSRKISVDIANPKVPWCRQAFYLPERPSFTEDPVFHSGSYYVQEASSMLTGYFFDQLFHDKKGLKILDLCAAPGGKSTHIADLIDDSTSLLISNEVIQTRASILSENVTKWGKMNHWVTQLDPINLGKLQNYFDAVIIDAPCTGSGLWRRDAAAMDEWSTANVKLCSERQRRIIADIAPSIRSNGYVIYSTCSYSKEENEDIVDWITDTFQWSTVHMDIPNEWNISSIQTQSGNICYRCAPWNLDGEGFFIAIFETAGQTNQNNKIKKEKHKTKPTRADKSTMSILNQWLDIDAYYLDKGDFWCAIPTALKEDYEYLDNQQIRLKKTGTAIGKIIKNELIPHEELALSIHLTSQYPKLDIDLPTALKYLRKEEILADQNLTGWHLVTYQGHTLGWGKWMPNRMNNYYPQQWRIRMR